MADNKTWVKEFHGAFSTDLSKKINDFCIKKGFHPLSISVVHHTGRDYVAFVVLEVDTDG